MLKIHSCTVTCAGRFRENNEDNCYINGKFNEDVSLKSFQITDKEIRKQYLYAVFDGLGGEKKGELASLTAAKILTDYQSSNIKNVIGDYIKTANKRICKIAKDYGCVTVGTTFVLLCISNKGKAVSYNIGDSRAYHYRSSVLKQISEDHTLSNRHLKMGFITESEVDAHKDRHVLTQHLGIMPDEMIIEPYVSPEITPFNNDIFLLCSDGLTETLSNDEIYKILSLKEINAEAYTYKLIDKALSNGGKDNITAMIIVISK